MRARLIDHYLWRPVPAAGTTVGGLIKAVIVGLLVGLIALVTAAGAEARDWKVGWSQGVSVKSTAGGGFYFTFPTCPGHVNEIYASRGKLPVGGAITVQVRIVAASGNPRFKSLDPAKVPPGLPPNMRLMLQRQGDDWVQPNGRWYPAGLNCVVLKADGQTVTYSVKLKPNLWSNVYGKYDAGEFKKTLSSPGILALVFGGGISFAHGDCSQGGIAKVIVQSVTVK